jgi:hypothetical protein
MIWGGGVPSSCLSLLLDGGGVCFAGWLLRLLHGKMMAFLGCLLVW